MHENYEAFFCMLLSPTVCDEYLGMENGSIPDESIKASSECINSNRNKGYARQARLNGISWWRAHGTIDKPWIQADIGYQTYVSGVVTQGDGNVGGDKPDWVSTLKVSTFMSTTDPEVFVQYSNGTEIVSIRSSSHNGFDLHIKHNLCFFNRWQLAKMKKSIPDMSLP